MSYCVEFTYPDGHTEEIQDSFVSKEEAVRFGKSLITQANNTESFHGANEINEFGFKKKKKPHFIVFKKDECGSLAVYDSRKD